ncbi:MAG: hypothetical protein HC809_16615 [Gammaproteobacteria bacterium]|nr:hypothetical protein [Gammaproteobacteria bacterium]
MLDETATGSARVIDFMPPREKAADIVRIVEGVTGSVAMHSELVIRFEYGRIVPWMRRIDHTRVAIAGPDGLCLRTPVEIHGEGFTTVSDFTVKAGERVPFVLTWFPSHEAIPDPVDTEIALAETESFWEEWGAHDCLHGNDSAAIHDSLIVLKALTYDPTGGIVAAPTTSLPRGNRRRPQLGLSLLLAT